MPNVQRMQSSRLLLFAVFVALVPIHAAADDTGTVAADARILLSHTLRAASQNTQTLQFDSVSVRGDAATVRWHAGTLSGALDLERRDGRWFAVAPASVVPWNPQPLASSGGVLSPAPSYTGGYEMALRYAPNDALPGAQFSFVYGRSPTKAEFLPYPTTYPFTSESVFYFDLTIGGARAVTFARGGTLDIWFPFVLDDRLHYDLFLDGADREIGPLTTSTFDNTLHFVLPSLRATPGKMITGEIDGDPH